MTQRDYSSIDPYVKSFPHWVVWKLEWDGTRFIKVPYDPKTGEKASTTDSRTWGTFEQALAAYQAGGYDGVGFVLSDGDPFVFIDLDNAIDPEQAAREQALGLDWYGIREQVKPIFEALAPTGYIARSQSGKGLHILAVGKLPGKGGKTQIKDANGEIVGAIEMYDGGGRFVALTGDTIASGVMVLSQKAINRIYRAAGFGRSGDDDHGAGWGEGVYDGPVFETGLSDDEVIAKARAAKNGEAFAALFDHGDLSAYDNDHSKADAALVGMLAFWCGPNTVQIDRIFRRSALARDKWDEQHGAETYGERTIGYILRERGSDKRDYYNRHREKHAESTSEPRKFRLDDYAALRLLKKRKSLIDGVLPEGALAMLTGSFGTFKSFTALHMAFAVESGEDWHGRKTKAGPVVYIAAEGVDGMADRGDALLRHRDWLDPSALYFVGDSPQFLLSGDVDGLIESIRETCPNPVLIVIDTLSRGFVGGNENAQEDMTRYVAAADRLKGEFGATVLILHHNNKQGEYRGSTVLPGALDTMIEAAPTSTGVMLTCAKQKDAEPFKPIHLKKIVVALDEESDDAEPRTSLVFELDEAAAAAPGVQMADAERKALIALRDSVLAPLSQTQWKDLAGISAGAMTKVAQTLVQAGLVTLQQVGQKKLFSITDAGKQALQPPVNPFTQGDESHAAD